MRPEEFTRLIVAPGALLMIEPPPSLMRGLFHVRVPRLISCPPARFSLPPRVPPLHCTMLRIVPPLQFNGPLITKGMLLVSAPPLSVRTGGLICPVPLSVSEPLEICSGVVIG